MTLSQNRKQQLILLIGVLLALLILSVFYFDVFESSALNDYQPIQNPLLPEIPGPFSEQLWRSHHPA